MKHNVIKESYKAIPKDSISKFTTFKTQMITFYQIK